MPFMQEQFQYQYTRTSVWQGNYPAIQNMHILHNLNDLAGFIIQRILNTILHHTHIVTPTILTCAPVIHVSYRHPRRFKRQVNFTRVFYVTSIKTIPSTVICIHIYRVCCVFSMAMAKFPFPFPLRPPLAHPNYHPCNFLSNFNQSNLLHSNQSQPVNNQLSF